MVNAGDVAVSQVEDIDDALDDLTSNRFVMGTHSPGASSFGPTIKQRTNTSAMQARCCPKAV